ncbi:MAG TPA: alpha/beta hydrolase [Gammaproteobacteria bacterium]|nr:alpha/beta hydrolase [Gammaproteobacteria bacterium]
MPKPTLILLPGLVCDKTVWQAQIQAFSPTHNIIIPDLSNASTPEAMVEAALKNAPDSFALAGHSMGGWVALMVMGAAGERVNKLALLNTCATKDTKEKTESRLNMIAMLQAGEVDALVQRLLSVYIYKQSCEVVVKQMILRNMNAFINEEKAMLVRESCELILPHIQCKTLIIHANQDKIFNFEDAKIMCDNIAHSALASIDQCGHLSPMEAPAAVNDYLARWLSG